jgi:hypothetical protein
MSDIEKKVQEEFSEHIDILEEQSLTLKNILDSIDSQTDINLCMLSSTASLLIVYSQDMLRKLETVQNLISEGKCSESAIILRSLIEDVTEISYLAENPLYYRVFLNHKAIEEGRATGQLNIDTPQSKFNKSKEKIFKELGEEKLYDLYRALSAIEAHTGLQSIRDNVRIQEKIDLEQGRSLNLKGTAANIYISYIILERIFDNVVGPAVYLDKYEDNPKAEYEEKRTENRRKMNHLHSKYDMGNNVKTENKKN